ncbi:riboflavin synthase [Halobiforma lacisalsi AJ5]|uniref:Riboflavin synthase n=1 Tax=Natronobacterium lacisalsi AJ5 TaxID=358396 RepID=M0L4F9_NATLA|nr:riboflavin synthase [Halobiforma lacisalsi]APW98082.1 riboflavin synthase [Halobiforma lacisalsi AJ5]EMA28462.1 riboflavin synthase subunit alpha [Halobiforma lacisalsi AJ5]
MYTGVVESTGRIQDVSRYENGARVRIAADTTGIKPEDSVNVSGVCLTVESVDDDGFEAFLSSETVRRTYLADLTPPVAVNIERPLSTTGRFDGHVVKGTVDTVTEVVDVTRLGDDRRFTFSIPEGYRQYLVEKGAVALDGISLTVTDCAEETFSVAVVPTTDEVTALSEKTVGDPVHFEADILAKYVERQRTIAGY